MPIPVLTACCSRRTAHDDTLETAAPNPLLDRPATPVDGNSREGAETRGQNNRPVLPAGNAQRLAILAALNPSPQNTEELEKKLEQLPEMQAGEQRGVVASAWEKLRQAKNGRNGQEVDSLRPIGHGLAKGLSALTDPVTRSNAILWVAAYLANGRKTARETGDVKHRIDAMKQNETLWKDLIAQVPTFSVEHAVPAQRQILLALAEEIYPAGLTKEQVANLYQPLNGVLHRVRSMVKENEIGCVNRDIAGHY